MKSEHPAFAPSVVTCDGFTIPVYDSSQLVLDRVSQGRFAVMVEHDGTSSMLASLDTFRDALTARNALAMLVNVLFPQAVGDDE